jgi:hypothetical protein
MSSKLIAWRDMNLMRSTLIRSVRALYGAKGLSRGSFSSVMRGKRGGGGC